jgi:hypothetical protein
MYISVVLVVGKIFRVFFVGLSYTIMFEDMPNVDRVLQVCDLVETLTLIKRHKIRRHHNQKLLYNCYELGARRQKKT